MQKVIKERGDFKKRQQQCPTSDEGESGNFGQAIKDLEKSINLYTFIFEIHTTDWSR